MNQIIEDGRRFANTADLKISDMSSQAPVGTTLAILERTLKVMSAVQARIHYSLKQELKLLKNIMADNAPDEYSYEPEEGSRTARKSDYKNVDVIPVSDPNASTMAQKIVQYQAVLQLAQGAPQLYNLPLLHRQMLEVLGIKDAQKLVPMADDQKPEDPVTENQNILMMKPVKAFAYQDHEAHIIAHTSAMQDPKIAALVGQMPQAQALMAAMQAHIAEHIGFAYRVEIEKQLGMNLPPQKDEHGEEVDMDPQVESRLAPLIAQAAQRLLSQNQQQAMQQQAQQQAQDPMVQMQQAELQIKAGELDRKKQKDAVDAQLKQAQLAIDKERVDTQAQIEGIRIAAKAASERESLDARQTGEGLRVGLEAQKHKQDMAERIADRLANNQKGN
jgi:hypothetical protein